MTKYVPNTNSDRWIIVASSRTNRDENEEKHKTHDCIFCEGNELLTPQEVYRLGAGHPNTPGWKVRVIANKFPITDIHEVVIHSTDHEKDFDHFSHTQSENVLKVFKDRFNEYKSFGNVIIFNNHGTHSGASQIHPHSQIAVIPKQISLDMFPRERILNTILDTRHFTSYCPEFSQWPYEVWIAPKKQNTLFGEIDDDEIADLSLLFKGTTRALSKVYDTKPIFRKVDRKIHPFGYNFYIYPQKSWYLRIVPRFIHIGGFELATGMWVNMTDPSQAARDLLEYML